MPKHLFAAILCLASLCLPAEKLLNNDDFEVFHDQPNRSFAELLQAANEGQIPFEKFDGFEDGVLTCWIRIDSSELVDYQYLLLSNYFDQIELYYPNDTSSFAVTGRLVDFDKRSYSRGFYRNVVPLKETGGSIYVKLVSEVGYGLVNRALSQVELLTEKELNAQSRLIQIAAAFLFGIEFILLVVHLALLIWRPSWKGLLYISVILWGVLLIFTQNQVLFEYTGLSADQLALIEVLIHACAIWFYYFFSAIYLNAWKHSKLLYSLLAFPFIVITIPLVIYRSGLYFPYVGMTYSSVGLLVIFVLLFMVFKKERKRAMTYIIANLMVVFAIVSSIGAHGGLIAHSFLTTNVLFLGLILRDTVFTWDFVNQYFNLFRDSKLRNSILREEKEQLKQIEVFKTNLFNNVSHEIRSQLTLLRSPIDNLINNKNVSPEHKTELEAALRHGQPLLLLADEMQDISKLYKGELGIDRSPVEVMRSLQNITHSLEPKLKAKALEILIDHHSTFISANLDHAKFEKIALNLLSNVVRFAARSQKIKIEGKTHLDELRILITYRTHEETEDDSYIFGAYFDTDHTLEDSDISMVIIREYTAMHGGHIQYTRDKENNHSILLSFPNAIEVEETSESTQAGKLVIDPSRPTILLVEDHAVMRNYTKKKLADFNIAEAENGEKALKLMEDGLVPDLIITDYMMPKMDGHTLVTEIKKNQSWYHIPIIFLTANLLSEDKVKVLNMGVDDYIIKPFDFNELMARVNNTLKIASDRAEFAQNNMPDIPFDKQQSFKEELDAYILSNLTNTNLSNADLAYHFAVSERNLHRRIKLVSGQPPASYIREIRMQKARLMMETNKELSVSEVARECGIDNLAYFSQAFKKRFGKTPSTFML